VSNKELVIDAIERLPKNATLAQIRERVEFIAAIKEAQTSVENGKGIPIEEVEKQFSSWVKEWTSKSSGRRKHSTTSTR
jgi:hypothetical protein